MTIFRAFTLMLVSPLILDPAFCLAQMIVAHRGASHDAPENTLAAFELAWQQGSDGVEGDFYLTADRKIVCIHDRDTQRTGGQKLVVEQSKLSDLRKLEYGGWKHPKYKGEPIPTFEQVLRTVPDGKTFVIELKSRTPIVPVLAAELERLPTDSIKVLIISFDAETVLACRKLMPSRKAHWLTRFDQDEAKDSYHPTAEQIAATVQRIGAEGVGMRGNRDVIDAPFIQRLKQQGCREWHVWTIDVTDDARFFQGLGAIGITTNRPGVMVDVLDRTPALAR